MKKNEILKLAIKFGQDDIYLSSQKAPLIKRAFMHEKQLGFNDEESIKNIVKYIKENPSKYDVLPKEKKRKNKINDSSEDNEKK